MKNKSYKILNLSLLMLTVSGSLFAQQQLLTDSLSSRGEVTAAISTIGAAELDKTSAINPANALYGMIPGLTVLQNGGPSWNNAPTMYIRGVETLNQTNVTNTNILTIIDGFEQPLSSLSIAEIESISVLKDAAALAIYGMRGANGVLLVTTKRGQGRKMSVNVNYEHGITHVNCLPDFLNASDYAQAVNQARANDGLTPLYSQPVLDKYQSGDSPYLFPNVNWKDETLNKFGYRNNFNISFQQQTDALRHFTLINFENETGLYKPVDLNEDYNTQISYYRFNFRTNIDVNLTSTTKFIVNLSGNIGKNHRPSTDNESDIISAIYNTPSLAFPVKTEDNLWGYSSTFQNNPVAMASSVGYANYGYSEIKTVFTLEQSLDMLAKGLSVDASLSYNKQATSVDSYRKTYQSKEVLPVIDANGDITGNTVPTIYGINTTLDFSHSVVSQRQHLAGRFNLNYASAWGDNSLQTRALFQGEELVLNGQNNTYRHLLVGGNVHYAKAGKYFADVVLSYSGTNILPAGKRFGVFPAISAAWKLSEEAWLNGNRYINDLKLRASYGLSGNDQVIQNVSKTNFIGSTGYYFGSSNAQQGGSMIYRLASAPAYETSAKSNVGVDATFFQILDLTADAFYNKRTGIMLTTTGSISQVIGINPPYSPDGEVTNKGFEVGLYVGDAKKDFKYRVGGQVSYAKNKIVNMNEEYRPEEYLKRTGHSIGQAYGLESLGFFRDAADIAASPEQTFAVVSPGDVKYKNQNPAHDNVVNEYDVVPIGYSTQNPEFYYSASINLEYKGIGVDALFQGIANQTTYLNTPSLFWPLRNNTNITHFSDNAWTSATAETATLPRLSMSENTNNYRPNTIWYVDASYLKLRHVQLYYNLPVSLVSKLKLGNIKVYAEGIDLFSIDKIKCVDPEVTGTSYPPVATYLLGIQIGF